MFLDPVKVFGLFEDFVFYRVSKSFEVFYVGGFMSLLGELTVYKGSKKRKNRVGRGKGSGRGGTSRRGHKGQRARKSGNLPAGFEGGAMPLVRRVPKFGWSNARFKIRYEIVNISQLENWNDDEVSPEKLALKGWIRKGKK